MIVLKIQRFIQQKRKQVEIEFRRCFDPKIQRFIHQKCKQERFRQEVAKSLVIIE